MSHNLRFSVVGGDPRMARLAGLLVSDGHIVYTYGLEKAATPRAAIAMPTLREACCEGECVVWPLPMSADGETLTAPFSARTISIAEAAGALQPGQLVITGRVTPETAVLASGRGAETIDILLREDFAVKNAIPSAEGGLQIVMEETAFTLRGASVLVIGFGRIGRLLARYLKYLGAEVTAAARKFEDFAWIEAEGHSLLDSRKLDGHLGGFRVVINTVPAMMLGEGRLHELRQDCFCLDLASTPGGFDRAAVEKRGLSYKWGLSLPGKVAPETAALIVRDTVYNILTEKGLFA